MFDDTMNETTLINVTLLTIRHRLRMWCKPRFMKIYLFLFKFNFLYIFLDHFDVLISKIILKKLK
jgi:hypothetical protein